MLLFMRWISFISWDEWYFIPCLHMTNTIWYDGLWDESVPTSILDVIHMCGWNPHTRDMNHKSYTWIDLQSVMRLGISYDNVAAL